MQRTERNLIRKDDHMKLLGIDVSSYQGKPDWKKVAKTVKVAILRVHQKNGIDSSIPFF